MSKPMLRKDAASRNGYIAGESGFLTKLNDNTIQWYGLGPMAKLGKIQHFLHERLTVQIKQI